MKDLIYRQDLYDRLRALAKSQEQNTLTDVAFALQNIPSVDAVEVTRCRDCRFGLPDGNGFVQCDSGIFHKEDYFCAEGDRRIENA